MPVAIQEFELQPAPAAPPTPAVGPAAAAANTPPALPPPAQMQRAEIERRERALRHFAH